MLHLGIWVETIDGDSKCELPTLKNADDYPAIFMALNMDQDGNEVRMSGMFGNATYNRVDGNWVEIEYNERDNRGMPAYTLSWAT